MNPWDICRNSGRKTIAVDLDGVIVKESPKHKWGDLFCFEAPIQGAKEGMDFLKKHFRVVVHTARVGIDPKKNPEVVKAVENWLTENGIPFDEVWGKEGKPKASFYLDNRGFRFDERSGGWVEVIRFIIKNIALSTVPD
jgi:hypothetical protein